MNFTFLHASYDENMRAVLLWCKDSSDAYAQLIYSYEPLCFVALSQKQLAAVGLTGTPSTRKWGTEIKTGFVVEQHTMHDDLVGVLIENNQLFEHDIDPVRRFLLRHELTTGDELDVEAHLEYTGDFLVSSFKKTGKQKSKLHVIAYDIETYSPEFIIAPVKYPIISIGVYADNQQYVFSYDMESREDYLVICDNEKDMLNKFFAFIDELHPDIVVGFNSDRFDMWYIVKRALAKKWEFTLAGKPLYTGDNNFRRIITAPGPLLLDLYPFCRSALRTTLKTNSYSLNAISKEILHDTKKPIDLSMLTEYWDNKSEIMYEYFEYNLHDAKLTYDLCMTFLPNMLVFAELIKIDLHDLTRMGFAQLVENFLITRAFAQNWLVPALPSADELRRRDAFVNKGGYVHEPQPGLYKDVVVADFSSLYPSIIVSHNLDPAFPKDYLGDVVGFIPATIQELIEKRNEVKAKLKELGKDNSAYFVWDARSQNLKVLANAMYGYLSFNQSRWHSEVVAGEITSYGRRYVQKSLEATKNAGFPVLYGDTDSLFFTLDGKPLSVAEQHISTLNDELPGIMHLEVEGFFPAGIFVSARGGGGAKKRYALLREDDSMKIVGFETIRNDWSMLARNSQKELLLLALKHASKDVIEDFVRKRLDAVTSRSIPVEDFIIRVKMTKPLDQYKTKSPHTAVARRMIDQHIPVSAGTIVSYVIVSGSGPLHERARIPKEASTTSLDATYYVDNQLKPALSAILDVIGMGFPGESQQKGLGDF